VNAHPETCPLCSAPLVEPSVALKGGGRAHLACAERAAQAAWRRRRGLALGDFAIIAATLALLVVAGVPGNTLSIVGAALMIFHLAAHRRFWYFIGRDLRSCLRGRRRR
jgi:hypothetical protein